MYYREERGHRLPPKTINHQVSTPRGRNYSSDNSYCSGFSDYSHNSSDSNSNKKSTSRSELALDSHIIEKLISFVERGLENRISRIEKLSKKNKINIRKCKKEVKKAESKISKVTIMDEGKELSDKIKLYFKLVKCQRSSYKAIKRNERRSRKTPSSKNTKKKFTVDNDLQALKSYSFLLKEQPEPQKMEEEQLRRSETFNRRTNKKYGKPMHNETEQKGWGVSSSSKLKKRKLRSRENSHSRSGIKRSRCNSNKRITPKKRKIVNQTPRKRTSSNTPRSSRVRPYNRKRGDHKKLMPIRKTRAQILREKKMEERREKMKSWKKSENNLQHEGHDKKEWVGIGKREERVKISHCGKKQRHSGLKHKNRKKLSNKKITRTVKRNQQRKKSKNHTENREMKKVKTANFGFCNKKQPEIEKSLNFGDYSTESEKSSLSSPKTIEGPCTSSNEDSFIKTHDYYFNLIPQPMSPSDEEVELSQDPEPKTHFEIPPKKSSYPVLPVIQQRSIEEDLEEEIRSRGKKSQSFKISYREEDSSDFGLDDSSLQKIAESNICLVPSSSRNLRKNHEKFGEVLEYYDKNYDEERENVISMLDNVVKSTNRRVKKNIETAEAILSFYTEKSDFTARSRSPGYGEFRERKNRNAVNFREEEKNQISTSISNSQDYLERINLPTSSFRERILRKRGINFRAQSSMDFNQRVYEEEVRIANHEIKNVENEQKSPSEDLLTNSDFLSFRGTPSPIQEVKHSDDKESSEEVSILKMCKKEEEETQREEETHVVENVNEFDLEKKKEDNSSQVGAIENIDSIKFTYSGISKEEKKEGKENISQGSKYDEHSIPEEFKQGKIEEIDVEDKENREPLKAIKMNFNSSSKRGTEEERKEREILGQKNGSMPLIEVTSDEESICQIKKYLSLKQQNFSENDIAKSLQLFNSIPAE